MTSNILNKTDLINAVALDRCVSTAEAKRQVESVLGAVQSLTAKSEGLRITGFGTFAATQRAARQVRSPQSGEMVDVPAKRVIKFKVGTEFASKVV